MEKNKHIVYLSGAPRISTTKDAENTAARNHILEVAAAFEQLGFRVNKYILGNFLPKKMTGKGSDRIANKSIVHRILTDIFRLLLIFSNRKRAIKKYNNSIYLVYERFALMQSVGWAFKKKGIPWILETNAILSDEAYYESKTLYLKEISEKLEKWAYNKCDLLVTISDSLKNSIIVKYGIPEEKIFVMQNGVNTHVFQPNRGKTTQESFVIGYVGSLVKWQRLDLLLNAVNEIRAELPNLKVIIVGDGSEMEAIRDKVRDNKLDDIVDVKGRVAPEDVPALIESFSIGYCNPHHVSDSTTEGFNSPMKLYEYLAMGKPVITQKNYDMTRMESSDKYLYKLEGYELKDLINGIRYFYQKMNELEAIGEVAINEIQKNHSWNSRVQGMLKYFHEQYN